VPLYKSAMFKVIKVGWGKRTLLSSTESGRVVLAEVVVVVVARVKHYC
jgi:hypothetical protein